MNEEEIPKPTEQPAEDFKDKYFRCLADMENTRKRLQKEKQEISRFAVESAISEFLPSIDNFENALGFSESATSEVKNWALGFQMILSQFKEALHRHDIVVFHSEGHRFDPTYHEAVEIVETDEHPEGTILQEFTKGYKTKERVIRPARVKVAKPVKKIEETEKNIIEKEEESHD